MKNNKLSVLLFILFALVISTQFSCKKEESAIGPKPEVKTVSKKYFYLEEISKSGDTTRTPVITVN